MSKTLYLCDLDGTLLRSDERISEYTANTVNRFVREGGFFSYATARSFVTASKVTAGLTAEFPVICYNGAFIIDNATREPILANYFTLAESGFARDTLTECGVFPIVYAYIEGKERFSYIERHVTDGMRHFINSRIGDIRLRKAESMDELYDGKTFYFTCIDAETVLSKVNDMFRVDTRYNCIYQKDFYSHEQWCELLPSKATKANAALQLKQALACDRLVVFGDGRNDVSLFGVADECYAMANAVPELTAMATAVIGSNDDDGVARWLLENAMIS